MSISTTSSVVVAAVVASALLSDDDADTLLASLRKMHDVVRNMGDALPPWEKCNAVDHETIAARSLKLLTQRAKAEQARKINAIRAQLSGVFETHMNAAREEKAAYDALPATLKAKLGAFPETVKVPVSEIMGIFPTLTTEQVVGNLTNLSFKLGKGKERGAEAYIVLEFKPAPTV